MHVKSRPFPFPELEIVRKVRVVGGTNLPANTVVRLVVGENTSGAEIDGVAPGDFFGDYVVSLTQADYPTNDTDGPVDSAVVPPFIGILTEATDDDGMGTVVFRGRVPDLTCVCSDNVVYPQGTLVALDASNSWAPTLINSSGVALTQGDIVIGYLATAITDANGTSVAADVYINGIFPLPNDVA